MELEALIETICDRYLEELVEAQRTQHRRAGRENEVREPLSLGEFISAEERRMETGDRSMVEADARKLLGDTGVELPEAEFDQLCREIQATLIRGFQIGHF